MPTLPAELLSLIVGFAPLFSKPVWAHAKVLLLGAILAPGKRTITACLRVVGLGAEQHFQTYHRVLNRAQWSALAASRILLGLILALLPQGSTVVIGADDTIERRRGKQINGLGCYRDAVKSSRKQVVKCFGLKWLSLMVLVKLPWSSRVWALPFLTVLCRAAAKDSARPHKTAIDILMVCLRLVRRWLPERAIVLVVDGGYAAIKLALLCAGEPTRVTLVTRLRLDASLYHRPGPQPAGKRGRKPRTGGRQRSLTEWAARRETPWTEVESEWYGGRTKKLLVFSRTGLWYTPGQRPVAIRYVLVRDPAGKLRDAAFGCTNLDATPAEILAWAVMRWSVEVTFEEARAQLGMETQRQWSDKAIVRTTPVLLGLFSLVVLLAGRLQPGGAIPLNQTAWYRKAEATFSDCLALVRRHCWAAPYLVNSAEKTEFVLIPGKALYHLFSCLVLAA
ncbi:MAG TPA: transposase [Blastocatellia bacterium]|nr:transposase [Blastocatellia bacterium]